MKNKLRKIMAAVFCAAMVFAMAGCAKTGTESGGGESAGKSESDSGSDTKTEGTFPQKDITMIIPTNSGGGSDVIARYLATEVGEELGVTVVAQNIGGAATATAFQQLVGMDADGYTIIMSLSSLATMKSNGLADITYESVEQICSVNFDSNCIFIRPDEDRYTNIEEFVEYAKEHPGELNCGTGSAGGVAHIAIVDFCTKAGIELNIVPDTAGGGFDMKLINGDVDCIVCGPIDIAASVGSGDVVPIVSMTEERLADFPDIPTAKESGYDASISMFRGYHAPKGTPEEVIEVLEGAFKKVVESDEYKNFLTDQYSNAIFMDHDEWAEKCKSEMEIMPKVLEDAGITIGQ